MMDVTCASFNCIEDLESSLDSDKIPIGIPVLNSVGENF